MAVLNRMMELVCGTVEFETTNGLYPRLINLCASNNVSLLALRKTEVGFAARVMSYDENKLYELARKANVDIEIIKQRGAWFRAVRYKGRFGLAVGAVLMFILMVVSMQFVWDITVEGNKSLSTETIIQELDELGVKKGARLNDIDFEVKKQEALLRMPELAWMTLNRLGTRVQVIVSERYAPPIISDNTPCDIIATKTGLVKYMEVYAGSPQVRLGFPVKEGDKLVSGNMVTKNGKTFQVHASAKIIAEIEFDKTLTVDMSQVGKSYTGKESNRYYLNAFGIKLPLFFATKQNGAFDVTKSTDMLEIFGNQLPFGITKHHYRFYDQTGENLTKSQAEDILDKGFESYEALELRNAAILERVPTLTIEGQSMRKTITYTIEENIVQPVELTP